MGHFAKVVDNIVVEVIVAEQDFIDSGLVGNPNQWIRTSYNMRGGIHYLPNSNEPNPDQSLALRKNFAGIGDTYDSMRDAFIAPQPYNSWTLDEFSCLWKPPIEMQNDGKSYTWDEETVSWKEIPLQTPVETMP
jgi:hypothetical protein